MTEEEAIQLRKENQELREALKQTQELLGVALARIEELEKQKTPPPAFVKADVPKPAAEENKPRKKREAQHNRARLCWASRFLRGLFSSAAGFGTSAFTKAGGGVFCFSSSSIRARATPNSSCVCFNASRSSWFSFRNWIASSSVIA